MGSMPGVKNKLAPFRIVMIYTAMSILWIYFSDTLLGLFVRDPQVMTTIAIFKGFFFVLTTATLLFFLIRRDIGRITQGEEALKASERRFEQLIENSFDNIVVIDADGVQRYVSRSVVRTLGFQPSELVNIPVIEQMIHPEDHVKVRDAVAQIIDRKSTRLNSSY